jgi:hemolysin III
VPLYLIMGWTVLSDPELLLNLSVSVVSLLVAGGVLYTTGITFHLARMRFQEAIWHGFGPGWRRLPLRRGCARSGLKGW